MALNIYIYMALNIWHLTNGTKYKHEACKNMMVNVMIYMIPCGVRVQ